MRLRAVTLTAIAVGALVQPSFGQIIATSIPREDTGGPQAAAGERKFAFHVMASPFAKWKINSYVEEPKGVDFPDFQQASTTDSASKFILAGEVAFAASRDFTVGVGGWYNTLGEPDVVIFEADWANSLLFSGAATQKLRVSELHANAFYKSFGLQLGLVRTSATLTGFRAGSVVFDLETDERIEFQRDVTVAEAGGSVETQSTTNWDAFLVYKRGGPSGSRFPWGLSVGAGIYRDTQARSSSFSGFVTGSVQLFKGLGIDASYWYVGGKKATTAQAELGSLLGEALADNLSRFTIGIGYSFPR